MSGSIAQIGMLNQETLAPRLNHSEEHRKLRAVMDEGTPFKILGEFQPKGSDKIFKQIQPIEGQYKGHIISVCEEHIVITDKGTGSKEGPASKVGAVRGLAVA